MLLTALIMGFAGSLHCAGMCSPLALAVTNLNGPAFRNRLLYNLGRITMYGILGALIASIGYVIPLTKFQHILSIGLGVLLIALAAIGMTDVRIPLLTTGLAKITTLLKAMFAKFLRHKNPAAMMLLGALNGLLPCGLTFLALSFCITLTSPFVGFAYMFTFGIGTLPVMLGLVSIIKLITVKLQWNIKSITTGLMALSGILLIARVFLVHLPEAHAQHSSVMDIVICR
jgi:uncharacterized protein